MEDRPVVREGEIRSASEPILEISLAAIRRNWYRVRRLVTMDVEVAAVLKSDAYGLGLVAVGTCLADEGCRWFFVSTLKEALELRSRSTDARVSVLYPTACDVPELYADWRIEPVIGGWDVLRRWRRSARAGPILVHVDTGLGRCGIRFDQIDRLRAEMDKGGIQLAGIVSHLACAEEPSHVMNRLQRERFDAVVRAIDPPVASLAASAGLLLGRDFHYGAVRVGQSLLGCPARIGQTDVIEPAMRIRAPIVDAYHLPLGEPLGYGARATFPSARTIATLRIGYAHGFPERLGACWFGIIGSQRFPLVGRVSMECTNVDVTGLETAHRRPGTLVELIGTELRLESLAKLSGRTVLELMFALSSRLPRHYRDDETKSAMTTNGWNSPTDGDHVPPCGEGDGESH
jgi:alanine racemase